MLTSWVQRVPLNTIGSLYYATTMTTATKTPQICKFDNEKQYFCTLCTCIFLSFDILKTPSFFLWREMTCFALVWTTWAYDDKCSIFSCPEGWFQFNSWIVKAHFSRIMTLNNWKMIAETRSDIFIWRYRFRRRRVCLSSLLILPYEWPTGPGLTWQTMTHHRRSALHGGGIMGAYLLLIFNTHISFQSCIRRSTIDIRRSPRQHFLK